MVSIPSIGICRRLAIRLRCADVKPVVPVGALALAWALTGCGSLPAVPGADSDAPDASVTRSQSYRQAASYAQSLQLWRDADDINDWIGARFEYDRARAIRLSETQRETQGRMPIHTPQAFFEDPSGVCVDLARFAVETLRQVDPNSRPRYLMIEFDPVSIAGNTLRRHWVAAFERDGQLYFFADSKRPGHVAGPYPDTRTFLSDYARYRGRSVVSFREVESYERRRRAMATGTQKRNDGR